MDLAGQGQQPAPQRDLPRRRGQAGRSCPTRPQPPIGSTDPLDLYKWLENYEDKTGGAALAIAHNGNLSNGLMFPVDAQYTGRALDEDYVEPRAKWEPLYEVTQIKGDGEAHPFLRRTTSSPTTRPGTPATST